MGQGWAPDGPGVLELPSGRLVRGRSARRPVPAGLQPTYAVHLGGAAAPAVPWECRWLPWPDFLLPTDRAQTRRVLRQAWERAGHGRVEVTCAGGRGRTGTALACLAVIDGVPGAEAVAYVRARYDRRAVELPWQAAYVRRFTA